MALKTSQVKIPRTVITTMINKAADVSTIAALSTAQPETFIDSDHLIFSPSAEAEVVAEGENKGSYEQELGPVTGTRVKLVTTTRVTDELKWADEDNRLEIITHIQDDQLAALGRALDYVVYHAVDPKKKTKLVGYTALTSQAVSVTSTDDEAANLDLLADAIIDYDITGIAMSRYYASDLRKIRVAATGARLFPEIPLNLKPGSLDGIPAVTSGTVNGRRCQEDPKVRAIMGDFSLIRWGMVRDAFSEIIEYGDPDGTGVDLKRAGQVAYRTESMLGYAVLDPKAFAVLKPKEE